jgi:hypothetical protein
VQLNFTAEQPTVRCRESGGQRRKPGWLRGVPEHAGKELNAIIT